MLSDGRRFIFGYWMILLCSTTWSFVWLQLFEHRLAYVAEQTNLVSMSVGRKRYKSWRPGTRPLQCPRSGLESIPLLNKWSVKYGLTWSNQSAWLFQSGNLLTKKR